MTLRPFFLSSRASRSISKIPNRMPCGDCDVAGHKQLHSNRQKWPRQLRICPRNYLSRDAVEKLSRAEFRRIEMSCVCGCSMRAESRVTNLLDSQESLASASKRRNKVPNNQFATNKPFPAAASNPRTEMRAPQSGGGNSATFAASTASTAATGVESSPSNGAPAPMATSRHFPTFQDRHPHAWQSAWHVAHLDAKTALRPEFHSSGKRHQRQIFSVRRCHQFPRRTPRQPRPIVTRWRGFLHALSGWIHILEPVRAGRSLCTERFATSGLRWDGRGVFSGIL